MGAWGSGSFDNDTASDWLFDLEEADDYALARLVFEVIQRSGDQPEADTCCEAIAAAEVVAAGCGRSLADLPEEAVQWLRDRPPPPYEVVSLAGRAVQSVMANSELRELWQESDSFAEWLAAMQDLATRLAS